MVKLISALVFWDLQMLVNWLIPSDHPTCGDLKMYRVPNNFSGRSCLEENLKSSSGTSVEF